MLNYVVLLCVKAVEISLNIVGGLWADCGKFLTFFYNRFLYSFYTPAYVIVLTLFKQLMGVLVRCCRSSSAQYPQALLLPSFLYINIYLRQTQLTKERNR